MLMEESQVKMSIESIKERMEREILNDFHAMEVKRKNYQKVEVRTCNDSPVFAQIFIGGQKIEGIRNWSITHKAGDIPRLHIDINAMNLDIDGRFVCTAEGWGDFAMRMISPDSEEMKKEGE